MRRTLNGKALALSVALLAAVSCRSPAPGPDNTAGGPEVRFLLTFDDGPSVGDGYNPTLAIVHQLANNDLQPGIRAIFFVQTGHPKGGGSPRGHEIMRCIHEQGHLLGIHSTSPAGHVAHTALPTDVLMDQLHHAQGLIRRITGSSPQFVRPPFGACDSRTRTVYASLGLDVLMADVRARDGLIYGYRASLWRRAHMRAALQALRQTASPDATTAVIVNFHDVNPYTARHMTEYLHIVVEEARRAGFAVPERPFYDDPGDIARVASAHRLTPPGPAIAATIVTPPVPVPLAPSPR